jgi:hypothetical protein
MAQRYSSPGVGECIVAKGLAGRGRNLNRFRSLGWCRLEPSLLTTLSAWSREIRRLQKTGMGYLRQKSAAPDDALRLRRDLGQQLIRGACSKDRRDDNLKN